MSSDDTSRAGRRPGAYRLEEAGLPRERVDQPVAPARTPRAIDDMTRVALDPDDAIERQAVEALEVEPATRRRRGFSFGKLFVAALGVLVSLGVALAIDALIRDLFARYDWLGWVAVGVTLLLVIGAVGLVAREAIGLMRLSAVDRERREGLAAYQSNSTADARRVVRSLTTLLSGRAETARGRARLAELDEEVIDGADLVALAEREMLEPLDAAARTLVLASAKRVSVVTAVSPKALVDVAYVLFETIKLIRRMSELYGARPGTLGLVRLTRDVLAHLAVTGSIAIGDGVMQQLLGHGVAAKLSARMGEGVVNGLLTARVGLAAMDLCRPLPFLRTRRPRIGDIMSELVKLGGSPASRRQSTDPDRSGF
ncbi:MAG TPA: TIGR01620 family protein [Aurantimonas sp.]|jgi:putative membrane protein|nr:TIGR01620 family protein [Aurantimonas sp.]